MPGREDRDRETAETRAALARRNAERPGMAADERRASGTPPELVAEMRRRQFATLLEHSPDATIIIDATGVVCEWNPAAEVMISRLRADVVGRPISDLVPDAHRAEFDAALAALAAGNAAQASLARWLRPDGSLTVDTHVASIRSDGDFAGALAIIREGPVHQVADAASAPDARTAGDPDTRLWAHLGVLDRDELTGLSGRRHLQARLAEPSAPGLTRAVAVVDIDWFALVNQAYGPDAGDEVLRDLAERLVAAAGPGDVGRWQADSFVWIADTDEAAVALDGLVTRIAAALDEPFELGGERLHLTVSTGMVTGALAPEPDLLAAAMDALRAAKESGRDRALWYLPAHRTSSTGAFRLANDLHRGIENDELRLHFQPIVDLATNAVVGVEALVRWERPGVGLLAPVSFIGMAERNGQIVPLGAWVARHACAAATRLNQRADGPGRVSINLSARQLSDPGLVDMLRQAIEDGGCGPSAIVVEVTETALAYDLDAAIATLEAVKALGVALDLDDFGTGYSSLLYLRHFPVDRIKIDRSFVAGLGSSFADTAIIASTIALAHSIGITALAEGVETPDQLAALRQMGCDFAQGFLISRPVPFDALTAWLDEYVPARVERAGWMAGPGMVRDQVAYARDMRADSRDDVGDTRDAVANARDVVAAARDRTADEREKRADARDDAGGGPVATRGTKLEATERAAAGHRRDEALTDRTNEADDRAAADAERNASELNPRQRPRGRPPRPRR
jgi:diguanylate cyclase (GGDEF)-like protein/PAS domain S-box-containing protein